MFFFLVFQELHRLVSKREFRGAIAIVETSAVNHVNTDLPFMLLASLIGQSLLLTCIIKYLNPVVV